MFDIFRNYFSHEKRRERFLGTMKTFGFDIEAEAAKIEARAANYHAIWVREMANTLLPDDVNGLEKIIKASAAAHKVATAETEEIDIE